ncbi:MAG TPA: TetR/AcrR family transcriptional regulator [Firmicutes bacterium]|nr:TetR/AcrR family transcriptional regulator [Bacillota bacterium]
MRNLAARIGLSEAAIYRHFRDKEEIVLQLANQACDLLLIENLPAKEPLKALELLLARQFQRLSEKQLLTAVIFQEELFRQYPKVREKFQKHRAAKEKLIISLIEKGQEAGSIDPQVNGEVFALFFMGAIRMSVLKWKDADFSYSLPQLGREIMPELKRFLKGE